MSLDTHRALLESGREDQGEKKHLQPEVSHCCLNYVCKHVKKQISYDIRKD